MKEILDLKKHPLSIAKLIFLTLALAICIGCGYYLAFFDVGGYPDAFRDGFLFSLGGITFWGVPVFRYFSMKGKTTSLLYYFWSILGGLLFGILISFYLWLAPLGVDHQARGIPNFAEAIKALIFIEILTSVSSFFCALKFHFFLSKKNEIKPPSP